MFGTLFKCEVFVAAAETFLGSVEFKGEVVKMSSFCDASGRVAESASAEMTAYASQTLKCMFYCFLAPHFDGNKSCFFL